MEGSIEWYVNQQTRGITYSMDSRFGPNSYDCSSAIYLALKAGGRLPADIRVGNTDSLFGDLERNGWEKITDGSRQRGDVFIWGIRGASGGAAGHTGEYINSTDVIHCAYFANGITVTNHDWLWNYNGNPNLTIYRFTGREYTPITNAVDQIVEVGSVIRFDKTYVADDVQLIDGIWQVRTNELCDEGFTWEDNGIPAEPLVEIDSEGYATPDQELPNGSLYKIPGKFTVLDVGEFSDDWLAMIEWSGLKFWVDIETAIEVSTDDAGTPRPPSKPLPSPVTPDPVVPPVVQEPNPTPETPTSDTPPIITPPNNIPKEEEKMAFKESDAKVLRSQAQELLDVNDFTPVISDQVKTVAYFVTDVGAILSALIFTLLGVFGLIDAVVALMVNAAVVGALLGIKQTFRLSAKKQ